MKEFIIEKQTGKAFKIKKGDSISVIDIEGKQVADFFAVNATNFSEYFSAPVTIDCKESLSITKGDTLYTNLYQPMFEIITDDVGIHDLMIPCCRPEMYDHFFSNGTGHSNCFENINKSLREFAVPYFTSIQPLNIFMNTDISLEKKIIINPPLSQPGDKITLKAKMDSIISVSACSVVEGECNGGKCKSIKIIIETI